jgi:hypothetical protein
MVEPVREVKTKRDRTVDVIYDVMDDLQRAIFRMHDEQPDEPISSDVVQLIEGAILELRSLLAKGGA